MMTNELLSVQHLSARYFTQEGPIEALDDVSFEVSTGQTVGLVGESGCGKSTAALSILRLLPSPGAITGGKILFQEADLLGLTVDQMRREIRGNKVSMIFQEPSKALNPVLSVGDQIKESIRSHEKVGKSEANERTIKLLQDVGLPNPRELLKRYPFQLSGGMQQRVMIAMAISCNPRLLIADEPTSSLDVTIEAQILELLRSLMDQKIFSGMLFISHDLAMISTVCDKIVVMYAGTVAEIGDTEEIFERPRHPYTRGLMEVVPRPFAGKRRFGTIPGDIPSLIRPPSGCRFQERCMYKKELCAGERPSLKRIEREGYVACHL